MKLFGFIDCNLKKNTDQLYPFVIALAILTGAAIVMLIEYLLTGKVTAPLQNLLRY